MSSAAWELQKAIHGKLSSDAGVLAVLGSARVYDEVPRGAAFPYVTFGGVTTRDWSTGTDTGAEHAVTLRAWSKGGGEREVHLLLEAIRAALHETALTLTGHRLVSLRHEASEAARGASGETYAGAVRFRAVTEPVP